VETAVSAPDKNVETPTAPHARDRAAAARCARDVPPLDPTLSVPPAVAEHSVGADRENVDAVGVARRCGGLSGESAAERLPAVPGLSVQ